MLAQFRPQWEPLERVGRFKEAKEFFLKVLLRIPEAAGMDFLPAQHLNQLGDFEGFIVLLQSPRLTVDFARSLGVSFAATNAELDQAQAALSTRQLPLPIQHCEKGLALLAAPPHQTLHSERHLQLQLERGALMNLLAALLDKGEHRKALCWSSSHSPLARPTSWLPSSTACLPRLHCLWVRTAAVG